MTPHEYDAAAEGWLKFVKGEKQENKTPAMNRTELEEMMHRFPDAH